MTTDKTAHAKKSGTRGWKAKIMLKAIVTVGAIGALMACASVITQQISDKDNEKMAAFGQAHPKCVQWTNWRKTCSRLGRNSETLHCNSSSTDVPVSAPFCLAVEGNRQNELFVLKSSGANRKSDYNRYCTSFEIFLGKKMCVDRDLSRPFGGLRIAELRHPYCEIWGNREGQYCSERPGSSGLPSCQSLMNAKPANSLLSCFKEDWAAEQRDGCSNLKMGTSSQEALSGRNEEILPVRRRSAVSPVISPFCQRDIK